MWLMVMFDLPVKKKEQRRHAARFRKFLKQDGYVRMQWSIYARVCNGQERVKKHLRRLQQQLPPRGNVKALQITDRQYGRIKVLLGYKEKNELHPAGKPHDQLVLF
jgi:CRISPR-associated protein Cas2